MDRTQSHVAPEDLVRALSELGFVADAPTGVHTLFRHANGPIVTVPTGRKEVPEVFLRAAIGQATAFGLVSSDTVWRLLRTRPATRKAAVSA